MIMTSGFVVWFAAICIQLCLAQTRPNFVFLLTDDQDITLDSMQAMPNAIQYLAKEGITFNNTFISTPICCPSRTETISGRNFHNIKVADQSQNNCMHIASAANIFNNSNSMFQIFKANGYVTGAFGKVVNNQASFWCDNDPNTAGFDRVNCPCKQGNFYGTKWFDKYVNGSSQLYELNLTENIYQTAYIGNASIEFINDRLKEKQPFLMWIGPHAPHYPATPAAWYADRYNDSVAPFTPNFNESDSLKHSFVATNPAISDIAKEWIDQLYRDRLRSLLSVDDLIYAVINTLKNQNALDNTYFLFTSDHGYHLGQYDIPCSKQQPYEETIRIPMYFRGPNVRKNVIKYDIVGNIDIVPTFLSLAGIQYDENTYDGRSWTDGVLTDSNTKSTAWRDVYLSQYQSVGTYGFSHCQTWFPANDGSVVPGQLEHPPENNTNGQPWLVDETNTNNWRALRIINESVDWMYAEFSNSSWDNASFNNPYIIEFYDVKMDKYQQKNSYSSLSKTQQQQLHDMVMNYGSCSGTSCW